MKILHCSDLHGVFPWYEWLVREAPGYDLVCLAGDLLDAGSPGTIPDQMRDISVILGRVRTAMAICSGNHDMVHAVDSGPSALWVQDLRRPGVWTDGDRCERQGRRFYCHPWVLPVPVASAGDIWIIHSPPEGTATSQADGSDYDHGDFEFSELCQSGRGPAIALCGHIHEPRSWNATMGRTLVLNPGWSRDPLVPAHIVLDLSQRTATRHFPEHPPETVRLPGPTAAEILGNRTSSQIESLLATTVSNQQAEGIPMTPEEIEETRLRLRRLLYEQ
ncbi:MAG: metallophosphoesterase family protein [Verrucomicrobiota bacterium]